MPEVPADDKYSVSVGKAGIETMEFGSGVVGAEAPVDRDARGVAPRFVSRNGAFQGVGIGVSAFETGSAERAEFDLSHVQPAGVLGGVVKLQESHDASGFGGREGFVQGSHAVGVQIVEDHADHGRVGIRCVNQPLHLVGEVLHGAALGDSHMAPASQWLAEQEEVAGAALAVLVVLAPRSSRLDGQGFSHFSHQLGGSLVESAVKSPKVV